MQGKSRKKKVVVLGGGTGMPVLLRGLKRLDIDLTAIVTVADDGGSSGRLRTEMAMPAPGDIRNVIAALSEVEPMMEKLFQHRFTTGNGLTGHSMGNLILAAMNSVTGDFYNGIKEISRVFNVKGNIYPIANQNLFLYAEMEDGEIVIGESKIPKANKVIKRVYVQPETVKPLPEAVRAVLEADLVVIAPGSLYTSTMPNLVVPKVADSLRQTQGKVVYVCNVMTQSGETTGYTATDHAQAIIDHIGKGAMDAIVVHNKPITGDVRKKYAEENAEPVEYDIHRLIHLDIEIIEADIIDDKQTLLRHDTNKVANLLCSLI
ncbi:putative cofD-like protein [Natronobacillus azotifigens]|uniref:Gluconeogenesis factor n=1 Tax=Natronobacillus azotifigens TaxID=472978 RepID=A0A9J6RD94_9BACI|nr:YvcK family protein [Natronobacillus azotifigens]MCZ0703323.1 YvcK family protein [Natronobacillus azotifigens]